MDQDQIIIRGLHQNNLKNVSLDIPKGKIVVFTGVSGSGKSSIVFDTIAAESQRQMNETYTAFMRGRLILPIEYSICIISISKRCGNSTRQPVCSDRTRSQTTTAKITGIIAINYAACANSSVEVTVFSMPEQIKVCIILALYTGMRKGELVALKWSDIDFENNVISVSASTAVVKNKQGVKAPKTRSSHRKVSIPRFLTERLAALHADREKYRADLMDYWEGDDWVFIQKNGKQISYYTPYSAFHDAIVRYNASHEDQLPIIPLHGLRHTSATLLIANKTDIRTVSSRLGHAKTSTTMNIYAHALESAEQKSAETLESILNKKK